MSRFKKQYLLVLLSFLSFSISSFSANENAQIKLAKKYIEYEKFSSAEKVLTELLQNPKLDKKEIEYANFYLGRVLILLKKNEEAKKLYRNILATIPASTLNMVGLGNVMLLEGNVNEAQTLFDNAFLQTKFKEIDVFKAFAYAYTTVKTVVDSKYAILKLSQIDEKALKNADAEYYIAMGDFYKKILQGSGSYQNYQLALSKEPSNAVAKYKLSKIYLSQKNYEYFEKNIIESITLDSQYAPAYYDLYVYYYTTNISKSKEYFLKYKENTDYNVDLDFEEANIFYASGNFKEALDITLKLITNNKEQTNWKYYRLIGYAYNKLNDTINAAKYLDTFFQKAGDELIDIENYRVMAGILVKFDDKQKEACKYYELAYLQDSVPSNKVKDVKCIIDIHKRNKNYKMMYYWSGILYNVNPKQNKIDLFNWGLNALRADETVVADSIFGIYIKNNPEEYFGYYYKAKSQSILDTTLTSSVPLYEKTIEIVKSIDSVKYAKILLESYTALYSHERLITKDYERALEYLQHLVLLDPQNLDFKQEQEFVAKYIEVVKKQKRQNTK